MVEVVALLANTDSSSSSDFGLFAQDADTEESDAPTDPELGRADYWTCIKCKNQKNNPMYRFCEKCYQVNKFIHTESFFARMISWYSLISNQLIKIELINKIPLVGDEFSQQIFDYFS